MKQSTACLSSRRQFLTLMASSLLMSVGQANETPPWLDYAPSIPNVILNDSTGQDYRLLDLVAKQPVAISFFFSQCQTLCPLQTALFHRLQGLIKKRRTNALLLSITLDPANDNPHALDTYAASFKASLGQDEHWLMLTGDLAALEAIWTAFDSLSNRLADHAGILWIGSATHQRWTRIANLPTPPQLLSLLEASAL